MYLNNLIFTISVYGSAITSTVFLGCYLKNEVIISLNYILTEIEKFGYLMYNELSGDEYGICYY